MITSIFLFYSHSIGPQRFFVGKSDIKMVETVTFDGSDYVLVRFSPEGVRTHVFKAPSLVRLINGLKVIPELSAIVACAVHDFHIFPWRPISVYSCNELARYVGSVDIGFCFNPFHLYKKLLKLDNKRNYTILYQWRRESEWTQRK